MIDIDRDEIRELAEYATERMEIWHRKEVLGEEAPWTDDDVLREYKFTNVYRDLDHMTRFEAERLRDIGSFRRKVEWIALFRHTISKHVATYLFESRDPQASVLYEMWDSLDNEEFVSSAIRFIPFQGMDRVEFILHYHDSVRDKISGIAEGVAGASRAREVAAAFEELPKIGPFRGYEMYTSATYLDEVPFTEDDYPHLGGGAAPAADRMVSGTGVSAGDVSALRALREPVREELEELGFRWIPREHALGSWSEKKFTYRTLEDLLCEYRKYRDLQDGGSASKRYRPRSREWMS